MSPTNIQSKFLDLLIEHFDRLVTSSSAEPEIDTALPPLVFFNGAVLEHDPTWVYD
jgi:hypothetical protein